MVRQLGPKIIGGHFITIFLQHENICKMVKKVINNLLFRQGNANFLTMQVEISIGGT